MEPPTAGGAGSFGISAFVGVARVVGAGVVGSGVVGSGVVGSGVVGSAVVGFGVVGSGAGTLDVLRDVLAGAGFVVVAAGAVDTGALDAGALDAGALDAGALDAGALEGGPLDDEPGSPGTVTVGPVLGTGGADDAVVLPTTPPVGWAEVPVPHEASTVMAATAQARTVNDFRARM